MSKSIVCLFMDVLMLMQMKWSLNRIEQCA